MDLEAFPSLLPSRYRRVGPVIHPSGQVQEGSRKARAWLAGMVDTEVYQLQIQLQLQAPGTSVLGYIVMMAMEW